MGEGKGDGRKGDGSRFNRIDRHVTEARALADKPLRFCTLQALIRKGGVPEDFDPLLGDGARHEKPSAGSLVRSTPGRRVPRATNGGARGGGGAVQDPSSGTCTRARS